MDEELFEDIRVGLLNINIDHELNRDVKKYKGFIEVKLEQIKDLLNRNNDQEREIWLMNHYVEYNDYLLMIDLL